MIIFYKNEILFILKEPFLSSKQYSVRFGKNPELEPVKFKFII